MPTVSRPTDRIAAELLERLAHVDGIARACSLVLERVAAEAAVERALLVVWADAMVRVVGYGVPDNQVQDLRQTLKAGAPGAFAPLQPPAPVLLTAPASAGASAAPGAPAFRV